MRYLGCSVRERQEMLREIGVSCLADLLPNIPQELFLREPLPLEAAMSEIELSAKMKRWADANANTEKYACFVGGGAYHHYIPAVIDALISRSEFLTAYTPYQSEVSQGTLQSIFEFQSYICLLTGREVANASLYDGSTATAEAAFMAARITGRNGIWISQGVHPEYRQVLETYTRYTPLKTEEIPLELQTGTTSWSRMKSLLDGREKPAVLLMQSPNFFGCLEDIEGIAAFCRAEQILLGVAVTEPLSMALVKSPGERGADIVFGEAQAFGIPLSYGGPYVGFFATRDEFRRYMPGRIVGRAKDSQGKAGFVLTLATREQHIRREKATSNICTNEGLCALMACIYLGTMGKQGLREVAEQNLQKAHWLKGKIEGIPGYRIRYAGYCFNEFVICTPVPAREIISSLAQKNLLAGIPLDRYDAARDHELLLCVTERNSRQEMEALLDGLQAFSQGPV